MDNMIFKRKIYEKLLAWKNESHGATALLIEGARRIGKSTIAEEFARNEYDSYILIDFANTSSEVVELFDDVYNLDLFFLRLQTIYNVDLMERKSVIIFDEVQLCPKARQSIKYLVKDGRYDYIETGSLISIKRNTEGILVPSEEDHIDMFPMDFEEFLQAIGEEKKYELIRYCYEHRKAAGDAMHRVLMRLFRLYMLVGGMPQSVAAYLTDNSFTSVDKAKRRILRLYDEDFRKIDPLGRAGAIFKSIPSELARDTVRYRVGSVLENGRPSRLEELFVEMGASMTVNFAYHSNDPGIGMPLHANYDFFKLYACDTGLFVSLGFMDKDFTENDIYRKLLSDKLPADLGYLYENVVAQMLRAAGHSLFYYTFRESRSDDAPEKRYEIDFLVSSGDKICPIEVKSSGYRAHRSIDEFKRKFPSRIKERFLLYTKDLHKDGDLICLPVYMTGLL